MLHKKGRKWFLTVDGKEHEIKSRRPSFDHAEGLLRDLGKTAMYDYDRTAADERPPVTIECEVADTDGVDGVLKILHFLKWCGDVGASRGLTCDGTNIGGFDGDGADRINEIRLNGKLVEPDKKTKDDFNKILR